MKILIADDDIVSRMLLSATLKKMDYEVIAAENGQEAWEIFRQEYVPIIISDWIMPDVDGLELCRLVRNHEKTRYTYIILLTAMGGRESYLEGMNAGADDFITKPFDRDQMAARLRVAERIIGLQSQVKQLEGLLPICMYCKKIRDEEPEKKTPSDWVRLEDYIASHSDASFSHGICPDCYESRVKPEIESLINKK